MSALNRLITISSIDPDDARRRKLLNILLVGLGILMFLLIVGTSMITPLLVKKERPGFNLVIYGEIVLFIGMIILFFLNKYLSGKLSAILFLILITAVMAFSDEPIQVAAGRSLFVFTIPIIMASVLLAPISSFYFAAISSAIIFFLATSVHESPNTPAMAGYFLVAFIAWLSSRNLETALLDLRIINANLDKLVEQKTHELAATLMRELVLAGRNQAILDSIADGVIVFDANHVSILANPALSRIIETPVEELMKINLSDFIKIKELSPANQGIIMGMIEHPDKIETSIQVEWGKKTLSLSVARVKNSETSQDIGAVTVIRDITREAELEKMKNTFIAVISHELRTPLNAILGYAEMLKEAIYGAINEKQTSVAERIIVNTQRLLSMVGDLLDEAQIKAGKLSLTKQPFKTASLLEAMHTTMDKITADKGLYLTDELDLNMPDIITGDAQRLQQVLINLVNNSAKFTDEGGIHVRILRSDISHWTIEVKDTGIGISKTEIPYIFETFRQVENSTIRKHGGFGLGLAIVKQIVELMKGEITVNSEPGKGSTFIIRFPLQ
jgi:two-component system phosphate regulon sensor histidine kinase PhoR